MAVACVDVDSDILPNTFLDSDGVLMRKKTHRINLNRREDLEQQLNLLGLLYFKNLLKPDT